MKISTVNKKQSSQKHKTTQETANIPMQTNINKKYECLFFQFQCGSNSQKNKETLKNERQKHNQTHFQLSSSKNLHGTMIPFLKKSNENQILKIKKCSDQKQLRKSIALTGKKSERLTKQKNISNRKTQRKVNFTNTDQFLKQSKIYHKEKQERSEIVQSKNHLYHQLNPLSIDRKKYDLRISIGGEKSFTKTRYSFIPRSKQFQQNSFIQTAHSSYSSILKPQALVFHSNYQQPNVIFPSSQNHNYLTDSYHTKRFVSNKHQNTFQNSFHRQIQTQNYQSYRNPYLQTEYSPFRHENQTHYHAQNTSMQETNHHTQANEIFTNIQFPKPIETSNDLQGSTFSNYSSKYKDYMLKQLTHPLLNNSNHQNNIVDHQKNLNHHQKSLNHQQNNIMNLMESVRLQCDSVDQQQNQKYQTKLTNHYFYSHQSQDKKIQYPASISSSFVVVQGKQREIQNAKKIYYQSQMGSSSIPDINFANRADQFSNFHEQAEIFSRDEWERYDQINQNNLYVEIQRLYQNLNVQLQEERYLKFQHQQITQKRLRQLEKDSRQLEYLKLMSEQRSNDIDILRQLLKVKKIQKSFDRSQSLKQKYFNDEKGWESYIKDERQFGQLDLSDQTSETQNQQGQPFHEKVSPNSQIQLSF